MKVVLGYSGGLDTSIIVPWLRETYDAEVICMAADVGQNEDLGAALEAKAKRSGASALVVEDLKREFMEEFAWPTLRAGAVYSRNYLLGTSMARPLIARRQVEVARRFGADALAHGCTGKGNDQVRFELTFAALAPDLKVIAPWREWDIRSREDALAYARARDIPLNVDTTKLYSRDENLWHISHEGGPLEDPANEPEEAMFKWTTSPEAAPDQPEYVSITFAQGTPVALDGKRLDPVALIRQLNALGSKHGVGRADVVEDRLVGMKSRGVYETPGGTILYAALTELESITLDRRSQALKDQLAPRYADLVYEGRWWTPEKDAIDAAINVLLKDASGTVKMKLYKGRAWGVSRTSARSLYREDLATFGASASYDHADANGFIKLFTLPQRAAAARDADQQRASAVDELLAEVAAPLANKK